MSPLRSGVDEPLKELQLQNSSAISVDVIRIYD